MKVKGVGWRYCQAAFHDNGKVKPNVVNVDSDKHEEMHSEGAYYLANARASLTLQNLRASATPDGARDSFAEIGDLIDSRWLPS